MSGAHKSVQATAAAPFVFNPLGFSFVMVSFLSSGPAAVPDLSRWAADYREPRIEL